MAEEAHEQVQVVNTGRVITERSDFDRDLSVRSGDLGEDWGDGFFVDAEPVIVQRDVEGEIVRTTPLSEHLSNQERLLEQQVEEAREPVITPQPLNREQRDKLVFVLAKRLFDFYREMGPNPMRYNPVYDGIPTRPRGVGQSIVPRPGTQLYDATPLQVFDWLKEWVRERVEITNKRQGWEGYRPTIKFKVD
jgi:hypothetical protein